MSGSVIIQLPVVSGQLSTMTMAITGCQSSDAAPSSGKAPDTSAFGNVLSAKMTAQAGDGRSLLAPYARSAAEMVSGKRAESTKSKPEKQKSDDLRRAQSLPLAEILPRHPMAAIAQGSFCPAQEDLNEASVAGTAASENSSEAQGSTREIAAANQDEATGPDIAESALGGAMDGGERLPIPVTISSPEVQQYRAIQNTPESDKQGATATAHCGKAATRLDGDASSSPSGPQFGTLLARAAEQIPGAALSSATAMLEPMKPPAAAPPETSNSEFAVPTPERSLENDGSASAGLTTSTVAQLTEAASRIVETKTEALATPSLRSATPRSNEATSGHGREALSEPARRTGSTATKPWQTSGDAATGEEQSRTATVDSAAVKAQAMQPPPAITTADGGDKPGITPGSLVLGAAPDAAATAEAKDAKPQAPSAAPSPSPAENTAAAPALIQSARVLERMGQSEMRLGLNSGNFGSIELHTHVNQDQVGASIATSHAELRAAMMAEMPSLEHAIAQHQLKLDSFNLDSRTSAQNGGSGDAAGNQSPRSWTQSGTQVSEFNDDMAAQESSLPQAWAAPHSSGLNVHA